MICVVIWFWPGLICNQGVQYIYIYITTYKQYNFSILVVYRIDNITYRKYKDLISEKPLIFFLIL